MKKLLFILAAVAVYGLSVASVKATVSDAGKLGVTLVASDNAPSVTSDDTKKGEANKKTKYTGKKVETACPGKTNAPGCCEKAKQAGCNKAKSCCGKMPVPASDKK